jgi:hypothetical protein
MDKQHALDQHRTVFLATIDYLLQNATGRVIVDNEDALAKYYEKLILKAEKLYQAGNLKLLQRVMREIHGVPRLTQNDNYVAFMKERTGYDSEILTQTLPVALPNRNKSVIINSPDVAHKMLAEIYSPDNKRKITVRETSMLNHAVMTNVDIQFGLSGASVYMAEGVNLDINIYWKDNHTLIIETRKDHLVKSKHGKQYQCLNDVVNVEYVVC